MNNHEFVLTVAFLVTGQGLIAGHVSVEITCRNEWRQDLELGEGVDVKTSRRCQ
jgi:hypothetical protein